MKIDIFPLLVEYHYQRNLVEICKPLIKDGKVVVDGNQLQEGSDANVPYHGFLFLVDGPEIFNTIVSENIINDVTDIQGRLETITKKYEDSTPLLTRDEFFGYLRREEHDGEDGAYILNSETGKVVRVSELSNSHSLPQGFSLMDRIPKDFVYKDGRKTSPDKIGTKTRIAIKIPVAMKQKGKEVHTYQIKRTPYTDFGMGKVTHFDYNGLNQEFFFVYENGKILGVYKKYSRRENGLLYKSSQEIRELDKLQRFCESRNQFKQAA